MLQQLYNELCASHPGFVPGDTSPEVLIRDIQTAQYDADNIASWKGTSAEHLTVIGFCVRSIHSSEPPGDRQKYHSILNSTATTMIASSTFDDWKRNNVLTGSGLYETTSWPQQLALAKLLYNEAYGSHPGFVADETSPEDVIRCIADYRELARYQCCRLVSGCILPITVHPASD